jgi:two-component system, NarL family, invasion response regulator UvrY
MSIVGTPLLLCLADFGARPDRQHGLVTALQILSLLAEGKPYAQIATDLHVSYKTIANTCGQLKSKLGVHSLPELMRMAIQYLPSMPGQSLKDD